MCVAASALYALQTQPIRIDNGGFGDIWLGTLVLEGCDIQVIMKVPKHTVLPEMVAKESGLLAALQDMPCMVTFYGVCADHGLGGPAPALVFKYMPGGPVSSMLQKYFRHNHQNTIPTGVVSTASDRSEPC